MDPPRITTRQRSGARERQRPLLCAILLTAERGPSWMAAGGDWYNEARPEALNRFLLGALRRLPEIESQAAGVDEEGSFASPSRPAWSGGG